VKIKVIVIAKTDQKYLVDGIQEYVQRIGRYCPFEFIEIPALKNTKNLSFDEQKKKEGELIIQKTDAQSLVILLDDKGQQYTSVQFSKFIQQKMNMGTRELVFVVGGPYGFSPDVYALAQGQLSLSKLTFSHQMVRLIFVEQLYRAFSIMNNEPYHHE